MRITQSDLIACDKVLAKRSLSEFLQMAWPSVVPGDRYIHNWHMDAMCEHLEAAAKGQLNRLLINVPPGTSKSSATGVFFPAWLWGPFGKPHTRFIGASHSEDLAKRDNRLTRSLLQSDWYQNRWPTEFEKVSETYIENIDAGFRQATPVKSMTGKRGHFVVWDDPQNPLGADSEAERDTAIRVLTETLPSRMVDPEKSTIIVVMQRLNEADVSGYILENDLGYEHLMLPMEFEPERKCYTSIGFEDPRTKDGELLFEKRFPRHVVERDKKAMGSFAVAGQFQQRPAPRGGLMFQRADFDVVPAAPSRCRWVRAWDFAATDDDPGAAWTRGLLMGISPDRDYYIADVVGGLLSSGKAYKLLRQTAKLDGAKVDISIPQDPGQAGKSQANAYIKGLAGYTVTATPESGDKVVRARPLAAQVEAGNVKLILGPWNKDFLDEVTQFPAAKRKDQVDAASRAFAHLTEKPSYSLSSWG